MSNKNKLICVLGVLFLLLVLWAVEPATRAIKNTHEYAVQKVDDVTNYETIKEVEDTCRAMISSYETDKLTYEQYKGNDNEEKQSWGEQAKMRANKTANSYNNFILKNSFVWKDNVPSDIHMELEIIQ